MIQYFNGADRRARTRELVALAAASTMSSARTRWKPACVSCGCWPRMPPYNRRSRFPHRWWWWY
ncbi:hypothetical protein I552_10188 [Mycobacterium xenopi 3993]|nr:hypothetical protein I552_10188 [Mycobacterium xenopi 3993]